LSGSSANADPYYQKYSSSRRDSIRGTNPWFLKMHIPIEFGRPRVVYFYSCHRCGRIFSKPSKNRLRDRTGYCTPECRRKSTRDMSRGRRHSKATRKKQSEAAKKRWQRKDYRERQRRASERPEVRQARSRSRMGARNPRWKGGRRRDAVRHIRSKHWKMQVKRAQKRNDDTCLGCGWRKGEVKDLVGHHIYPLQDYIDEGNDPCDYPDEWVATMCKNCHGVSDTQPGKMKWPASSRGAATKAGYPKMPGE
jgi:hypothetical protein